MISLLELKTFLLLSLTTPVGLNRIKYVAVARV